MKLGDKQEDYLYDVNFEQISRTFILTVTWQTETLMYSRSWVILYMVDYTVFANALNMTKTTALGCDH